MACMGEMLLGALGHQVGIVAVERDEVLGDPRAGLEAVALQPLGIGSTGHQGAGYG